MGKAFRRTAQGAVLTAAPRAKKSLGQHFLKDAKTSARIVDLLRITPEDRVLEIGPGPGAITGIIHERGPARFRLIEKDSYWAAHHAELERPAPPAVEVLNDDALAFPWESLEGPWKIISNLPYNVASPLMWDIVSRTPELTRAVFMIQKEVAERLYATPGTKDYGALSVWIQSYARVEWGFVVGPGAFNPPPKVDSAVRAPAEGAAPEASGGVVRDAQGLFPAPAQAVAVHPAARGPGRSGRPARRARHRPGGAARNAFSGAIPATCRGFWTFRELTSPPKHD